MPSATVRDCGTWYDGPANEMLLACPFGFTARSTSGSGELADKKLRDLLFSMAGWYKEEFPALAQSKPAFRNGQQIEAHEIASAWRCPGGDAKRAELLAQGFLDELKLG